MDLAGIDAGGSSIAAPSTVMISFTVEASSMVRLVIQLSPSPFHAE